MKENIIREYMLELADGVRLYTRLQLPEAEGRFPVIVIRTPYAPAADTPEMLEKLRQDDTHGYAVVHQHCRGTGKSEGICLAYLNERRDGLALLDWIRRQPFYNGEIFLAGNSYLSSVHYAWMNIDPPDVKAAFLAVQDTERYNILYHHGFFKAGLHGNWVMKMYKRNLPVERNVCPEMFRTMPLKGITELVFGETVPEIEEEIRHPDPADPFWQTPEGGSDYHDACQKCTFPILLATGFYDIYTGGVLDIWNRMTPERKRNCACVVTPYCHQWNPAPESIQPELPAFPGGRVGDICPDLRYIWFDHFRKGTPLQFVEKGKITYYTLFENQWHTADRLADGPEERKFHLHAGRTLETGAGEPGEITYLYNPYAPASFKGGVCLNFGGMQVQDPPNSRYDIISFLSEPFTEKLLCEGKIELELHCRSTAPDTCFYARLDLVRDGTAYALRDDIDSLCREEKDYIPGTERVLKFSFVEHSFEIQPGDSLRLDISSSCVPHFQVHTNRKGLQCDQTGADPCRNTVITGKSVLTLRCK
ncbi:MAG: CocE/NonD family hydrolase [Lentisphaeria bacterium]|nr:CocE/NonD family hydrolase [Lentisphaeria bacterium]